MLGGVSIGLMYDPGGTLVWAMGSRQKMFVLRIDSRHAHQDRRPLRLRNY